jgi:TetR/AcrR family transcriptional regulator, regulator of autoinduction and epiphytic fitness
MTASSASPVSTDTHENQPGATPGANGSGRGDGTRPTDGRTARAQRTRDRVVNAVLELVNDGNMRPTAREIADRAGISLRSVYVHFDDVDDLFRAAAQRHLQLIAGLLAPIDASLPLEQRVRAFATQRSALYERGGSVIEAACMWAPTSPALAAVLRRGQQVAFGDIRRLFAHSAPEGDAGEVALEAINVAASSAAWGVVRSQRELSPERAREVLATTVMRLLGGA